MDFFEIKHLSGLTGSCWNQYSGSLLLMMLMFFYGLQTEMLHRVTRSVSLVCLYGALFKYLATKELCHLFVHVGCLVNSFWNDPRFVERLSMAFLHGCQLLIWFFLSFKYKILSEFQGLCSKASLSKFSLEFPIWILNNGIDINYMLFFRLRFSSIKASVQRFAFKTNWYLSINKKKKHLLLALLFLRTLIVWNGLGFRWWLFTRRHFDTFGVTLLVNYCFK